MLSDPSRISFLSSEIFLDSVYEDGIGFQRAQAAGLPERKNPFHPAVALVAAGSLAAFSPQDPQADHLFCMVIGVGETPSCPTPIFTQGIIVIKNIVRGNSFLCPFVVVPHHFVFIAVVRFHRRKNQSCQYYLYLCAYFFVADPMP